MRVSWSRHKQRKILLFQVSSLLPILIILNLTSTERKKETLTFTQTILFLAEPRDRLDHTSPEELLEQLDQAAQASVARVALGVARITSIRGSAPDRDFLLASAEAEVVPVREVARRAANLLAQRRSRSAQTAEERAASQGGDTAARGLSRSAQTPEEKAASQGGDTAARSLSRSAQTPEERAASQGVTIAARQSAKSLRAQQRDSYRANPVNGGDNLMRILPPTAHFLEHRETSPRASLFHYYHRMGVQFSDATRLLRDLAPEFLAEVIGYETEEDLREAMAVSAHPQAQAFREVLATMDDMVCTDEQKDIVLSTIQKTMDMDQMIMSCACCGVRKPGMKTAEMLLTDLHILNLTPQELLDYEAMEADGPEKEKSLAFREAIGVYPATRGHLVSILH